MDPVLVAAGLIQVARVANESVKLWREGEISDEELLNRQDALRMRLSDARDRLDDLIKAGEVVDPLPE